MNATDKNILSARGEALAAHLLADAALRAIFSIAKNPMEVLQHMSEFIDLSLNQSGPAKGDANDEPNTRMREIARMQAMQSLDAIQGMLRNRPTGQ